MRSAIDHTTVFGPHSHTMRITGGMLRMALSRDRHVSPYDLLVVVSVTAGRQRIYIKIESGTFSTTPVSKVKRGGQALNGGLLWIPIPSA
jgi:hypothetical protein